jgi:hypothetical protein
MKVGQKVAWVTRWDDGHYGEREHEHRLRGTILAIEQLAVIIRYEDAIGYRDFLVPLGNVREDGRA